MVERGQRKTTRCRTSGFTLIEVLLVLAILVVLGSIVVGMFSGVQDQALKDAARGEIGVLKGQIEMYKFHMRSYPPSLEDLLTRPTDSKAAERWAGPYIDGTEVPIDPWDNPYKLLAPGKHNTTTFDLWSTGPDAQDGTEDDIGNW
jgi:general secretion pathway protein G